MDGAGRLARSLRSLRPQADLKAAAIGAVVLLRERLGLRARVPARAFSSEVDTGSRQENASNQESRAPFRFNRNGKGSRREIDREPPHRLILWLERYLPNRTGFAL